MLSDSDAGILLIWEGRGRAEAYRDGSPGTDVTALAVLLKDSDGFLRRVNKAKMYNWETGLNQEGASYLSNCHKPRRKHYLGRGKEGGGGVWGWVLYKYISGIYMSCQKYATSRDLSWRWLLTVRTKHAEAARCLNDNSSCTSLRQTFALAVTISGSK